MIGNDEDELGTFFAPSLSLMRRPTRRNFTRPLARQSARRCWSSIPRPLIQARIERSSLQPQIIYTYVCPARRIARPYAAAYLENDDGPRVYRYLFTHVLGNPNPFVGRGAVHTTDLPFIFHTLGKGGLVYTPTAAEQELSTTMATTWITFAKEACPNNVSIPCWPHYDVATDSYLEFNDVVRADAGVHTAHCDFWDGIDN